MKRQIGGLVIVRLSFSLSAPAQTVAPMVPNGDSRFHLTSSTLENGRWGYGWGWRGVDCADGPKSNFRELPSEARF